VLAAAVADPRVVYGGGWPELRMARAVAEAAVATPGKKALAMEGFAAALRGIPATICDNAGLDAAEVVTRLRAAHAADPAGCTAGVDVRGSASGGRGGGGNGGSSAPSASDGGALNVADAAAVGVGCMKTSGVTEAFRVKRQVLLSATEAAEMILRVDDIVKAAPRPRERE
jgi:T-complex protein 1 subunit beta